MAKITIRTKRIGGMLLLVGLVSCGLGYIAFNRAKQATFIQGEENIIAVAKYGGEQVQTSAEELSKLAEDLNGLVGQFKI